MISLHALEKPTYGDEQRARFGVDCYLCGALVTSKLAHTRYHRELVEWLRALRDGKVDG